MGFCDCCGQINNDTQICPNCYTSLVWDANFSGDYNQVEHRSPITPNADPANQGSILYTRWHNGSSDATTSGCNSNYNGKGTCLPPFTCEVTGFPSHAYSHENSFGLGTPWVDFDSSEVSGGKIGSYGFSAYDIDNISETGISGSIPSPLSGVESASLRYNNTGMYGSAMELSTIIDKKFTINNGPLRTPFQSDSVLTHPKAFGLFRLNLPSLLSGSYYKQYESTIGVERHGRDIFDSGQELIAADNKNPTNYYTGTYTHDNGYVSYHHFFPPSISLTFSLEPASNSLRLTQRYRPSGVGATGDGRIGRLLTAYLPIGSFVSGDKPPTNLVGTSDIIPTTTLDDRPLRLQGTVGTKSFNDIIAGHTFSDIKNSEYKLQITSSGIGPLVYNSGNSLYSGAFEVEIQIPELSYVRTLQTSGFLSKCDYGFASVESRGTINAFDYLPGIGPRANDRSTVVPADELPIHNRNNYSEAYFSSIAHRRMRNNIAFPTYLSGTGADGAFTGYHLHGTHFSLDKSSGYASYMDSFASLNHFLRYDQGTGTLLIDGPTVPA